MITAILCPLIGHNWGALYVGTRYMTYRCTRCGALSTGTILQPDQNPYASAQAKAPDNPGKPVDRETPR
jgi:hypothetical protein